MVEFRACLDGLIVAWLFSESPAGDNREEANFITGGEDGIHGDHPSAAYSQIRIGFQAYASQRLTQAETGGNHVGLPAEDEGGSGIYLRTIVHSHAPTSRITTTQITTMTAPMNG